VDKQRLFLPSVVNRHNLPRFADRQIIRVRIPWHCASTPRLDESRASGLIIGEAPHIPWATRKKSIQNIPITGLSIKRFLMRIAARAAIGLEKGLIFPKFEKKQMVRRAREGIAGSAPLLSNPRQQKRVECRFGQSVGI